MEKSIDPAALYAQQLQHLMNLFRARGEKLDQIRALCDMAEDGVVPVRKIRAVLPDVRLDVPVGPGRVGCAGDPDD